MPIYTNILTILWIIFIAYWLYSAVSSKRTIRNNNFYRSLLFRIGVAFVIYLFLKYTPGAIGSFSYVPSIHYPVFGPIGVIIATCGVALAIWARVYLGTNWGMPMSLKENPELVTTGPYAYIRNPIYTGVLLAMLGSVFVVGLFWLLVLVVAGGYFIYSSLQEEKIMVKEFPSTYPAYKSRTKMLIPFVF
jgi:protein-S-isoprenylcysteine O-methyltransferase Ste14